MNKLIDILRVKGLNASTLSEAMNKKGYKLSRIAIGNILNGKHSPKLSTLQEIADTLNVHVCDFIDERIKIEKPLYKKNEDGTMEQIGYLLK